MKMKLSFLYMYFPVEIMVLNFFLMWINNWRVLSRFCYKEYPQYILNFSLNAWCSISYIKISLEFIVVFYLTCFAFEKGIFHLFSHNFNIIPIFYIIPWRCPFLDLYIFITMIENKLINSIYKICSNPITQVFFKLSHEYVIFLTKLLQIIVICNTLYSKIVFIS